jgi:hypothetical protein
MHRGSIDMNQDTNTILSQVLDVLIDSEWKLEQVTLLLTEKINKLHKIYESPKYLRYGGLDTNKDNYAQPSKDELGICSSDSVL